MAGPALLLQEFGNLGTIFLSLPIAILLGMKRECVGACHSINRETEFALMQDMFGRKIAEPRKSVSLHHRRHGGHHIFWLYGNGSGFYRAVSPLFAGNGFRCGCGDHDGVGYGKSLGNVSCHALRKSRALASTSETISGIDGIYMAMFIGVPLCNWLYRVLEPRLGPVHDRLAQKFRKSGRNKKIPGKHKNQEEQRCDMLCGL